jgi:hypothetical protein
MAQSFIAKTSEKCQTEKVKLRYSFVILNVMKRVVVCDIRFHAGDVCVMCGLKKGMKIHYIKFESSK